LGLIWICTKKQDPHPGPHQSEKLDLDPHPHQIKIRIHDLHPDLHQIKVMIRIRLGSHLSPPSAAVYISYFALFSLIACVLDVFLDAYCSLNIFLHSNTMQRSWDG
jgi:hypothetical protein